MFPMHLEQCIKKKTERENPKMLPKNVNDLTTTELVT